MALIQVDMKRLLAFISIAHVAFIVFALSLGTVEGLVAGLFHALNHVILMASLFFSLDNFSSKNIHQLKVVPHFYMPIFIVSALAASGMPPFNGFVSELLILRASMDRGLLIFSSILLFNIFLILVVFLRMIKNILRVKTKFTKPDFYSIIPTIILFLLILIFGLYPDPILDVLHGISLEIFTL